MDKEFDATRAEVMRLFFAFQTNVAEQPGE